MANEKEIPEAEPEAGGAVLAGGYQYWNCLTVGPIQWFGDPPYRPSKIIAAGELTLMLGVVWINPANSPGGGFPGTVVLGGRDCRVRFETVNLSDVANGPDRWWLRTFDNPALNVYVFPWWRVWPDPGVTPNLYETTLTADVVQLGQPLAAFSTWHFTPDVEPGFLVPLPPLPAPPPGTVPPGSVPPAIPPAIALPPMWWPLWYGLPARFLVYKKD
jgi:hypothetical protein